MEVPQSDEEKTIPKGQWVLSMDVSGLKPGPTQQQLFPQPVKPATTREQLFQPD
jgi:hypothetical protein